jgi:fructan beta-fructosidase
MKNILHLFTFIFCISFSLFGQSQTPNYRPKYHYTPPKNWVNDPNGLVYLDGEYHLFTQYNPYGTTWGHMSWGHAISKDLQNWQTLPIAMEEYWNKDSTQTMLFSGCAVVDSLNTSGFFKKGFKKGLVAMYTSFVHKKGEAITQHQSLMYSADKGRKWKIYEANPVLDLKMKDFRDPNVIWYPERKVWILTIAKPLEYTVQFYESKNLINWTYLSEFGHKGDVAKIWECPSLSKIPVENKKESKWMLTVSSANKNTEFVGVQYFIGDFDGKNFNSQLQNTVFYMDEGKDFYAPIPYFNLPKSALKPIMLGWINNWTYANQIPTGSFRGGYAVPRELSLYFENGVYKLRQNPVHISGIEQKNLVVNAGKNIDAKMLNFSTNSYILNLKINLKNAKGFDINLLKSGDEKSIISYDVATETLSFDRSKSGNVSFHKDFASIETMKLIPENGILDLKILVDNSVVEIFGNNGKSVLSDLIFPTKNSTTNEFVWN